MAVGDWSFGTSACCARGSVVQSSSVYDDGLQEALRHKWIESQKRGMDLGSAAMAEWYYQFWGIYCRNRLLEHVSGAKPYTEFDSGRFGLISKLLHERDLLLDRILDRARAGNENLDIIIWAREWGLPMDRVIAILEQLDLNRARMDPNFPR